MIILDGKKVRDLHKESLINYISKSTSSPVLVIIQVGENKESDLYINQKKKFGETLGVKVIHKKFPNDVSFVDLKETIESFNRDKTVNGIIVQLPLPESLDSQKVIDVISPQKDVDGLTTESSQRLENKDSLFVPATARGILSLLKYYQIEIKDKRVVIIGRSKLVGRPTALLMQKEGAETVICHRGTEDIPKETKQADILIVAAGHPNLVTDEYVMPGQVIVDVGINTKTGDHFDEEIPGLKYVGDVDFGSVSKIVSYISPVPGGVGPMTVLSLFENLIDSHKMCNN